ncbi:hypothetical protein C1N81_05840 [Streptomyces sp. SGAir0957]
MRPRTGGLLQTSVPQPDTESHKVGVAQELIAEDQDSVPPELHPDLVQGFVIKPAQIDICDDLAEILVQRLRLHQRALISSGDVLSSCNHLPPPPNLRQTR